MVMKVQNEGGRGGDGGVCVCGVEVVCVSVRRWRLPAARPPPATPGPGPGTTDRRELVNRVGHFDLKPY
jgi:hypothetical protein